MGSELAEEHLLLALEESDGRFMVTMNGGTTRSSEVADREAWLVRTRYSGKLNQPPSARCSEDWSKDCRNTASHSSSSNAVVPASNVTEDCSAALVQPQFACKQDNGDDEVTVLRAAVAEREERIRDLERRLGLQESQVAHGQLANASNEVPRAANASENSSAASVAHDDAGPKSAIGSTRMREEQSAFSLGDMLAVVGMRLQEDANVAALVQPAPEHDPGWLVSRESCDAPALEHRPLVHRSRFGFDFDDS